jgi:UDP-N-acetylmuramoylalanine--D-glutamate ligase
MNIAVIGYGMEGAAALRFWQGKGATVTVCDHNPDAPVPDGVDRQLGEHYLDNLDRFDMVWRTAGVHPRQILDRFPSLEGKLTSAMNDFFAACPTKHIVGVTGTKGKGTTTTLTAKMLEAAGKEVFLGGNIGISPFDFLDQIKPDSWVVLELGSPQLVDIKYGPEIGICLMVVPEHLNWHADLEEYLMAKAQLFKCQSADGTAVYFADSDNSTRIASYSPGKKIPYFTAPGAHIENESVVIDGKTIVALKDLKLLGAHNWQNVCAAVTAVWQVTQDIEAMRSVLTTFTGLEHRLEFVRELDSVKYYDDSFGTTPETAIVAIQAFEQPKVLILGGSDKGVPFDELAKVVAGANVRQVIVFGNTTHPEYKSASPAIAAALQAAGVAADVSLVRPGGATMSEAVQLARQAAQPGDIVLLSTGTASFDMFANYKDRGNQFKQAVQAL